MRNWMIAGAGAALMAGGAADAQRMVSHGPGAAYPVPGHAPMAMPMTSHPMPQPAFQHANQRPPMPQHTIAPARGGRWGSKVGGRWWAGANAPGGWNAYRRPARGYVLPSYWVAPRFFINDWVGYGFATPPSGYHWTRYYDDAVLIDGRGSVYDTVGGVEWDRYDEGADYAGGYDDGVQARDDRYAGDDGRGAAYPAPYQGGDRNRRDNGLGGAAVGAVAGGVAGNLIAGRGNRLGGTLIGAGVGAAAGYAIDKNEDRGRRAPPPAYDAPRDGYGAGYPAPMAPDRAPPPPHGHGYPPPPGGGYRHPGYVSPDGLTTVTTTSGPAGYVGAYGPGATVTTVTIQTQPVVTTTTTEVFEDSVTYTRKPAHRTKYVRRYRAAPRCACR